MDKSAQDQITSGAGDKRQEADQQVQEENRQGPYRASSAAVESSEVTKAAEHQGRELADSHNKTTHTQREKAQITPISLAGVERGDPRYTDAAATDDSPQTVQNKLDYRFARTASELINAGMLDAALDILQRGIRQFPDYAIGYQVLGDVYVEQKKSISATFAYLEALKREPDNPLTLMKLGDLYAGSGHVEDAAKEYREAIRFEPDAARLKQRLEGLSDGDKAKEKRSTSVLATETAANLFLEQGYKEKARAIYSRLLSKSPDNKRLRMKLEECSWAARTERLTLLK